MYRFSSGLFAQKIVNGKASENFLAIKGSEEDNTQVQSSQWQLHKVTAEGRFWKLKDSIPFSVFNRPVDETFFFELQKDIDEYSSRELHPAIINGFDQELFRLRPNSSKYLNNKYKNFVAHIIEKFGLKNIIQDKSNLVNYIDDYGPSLLGISDKKCFTLPELPPIFSAPVSWRLLTWIINNHFSGPYPEELKPEVEKLLNYKRFYWEPLEIPDDLKTPVIEGLVYLLISRFIIIHENWELTSQPDKLINEESSPLVQFINLVQLEEERPWQLLY
jgi:hypothetical protein